MDRRRLATGLTIVFGAMSLVLAIVGVLANPVALVLAGVFAVVAGLFYYQASGRLARRVYRRVENRAAVGGGGRRRGGTSRTGRGGFGSGPREEWTGPHRRRGRGAGDRRGGRRRTRRAGTTARTGPDSGGLSARQAYDVLGLDPGAGEAAIRAAYRDRIKEVHPDTEGGDEETFRRVRTAYERLAD